MELIIRQNDYKDYSGSEIYVTFFFGRGSRVFRNFNLVLIFFICFHYIFLRQHIKTCVYSLTITEETIRANETSEVVLVNKEYSVMSSQIF